MVRDNRPVPNLDRDNLPIASGQLKRRVNRLAFLLCLAAICADPIRWKKRAAEYMIVLFVSLHSPADSIDGDPLATTHARAR